MRLSQVLSSQHLDRMFKRHWKVQGKRTARETGAKSQLQARGIPVYNPQEVLEEKKVFERVEIVGFGSLPQPFDETHPLYNERPCYKYRDHNALLEGLNQAKVITKTVELEGQGLLKSLIDDNQTSNKNLHDLVQRCILSSHVFDAVQEKLPRLHDPARPAWNFPRVYGIPDHRRNRLLTSQLLQLCETSIRRTDQRYLVRDSLVSVPFEKEGDLIQLELTAEQLLMSPKPLPTSSANTDNIELPDLSPIKHTITLEKENFYKVENITPLVNNNRLTAHTAIFHFNVSEVKNIYETEVTEDQIIGRTLMKSFAVAAAQARQTFGEKVIDLPKPITLQSVQTDGRLFHFMVFQLNTLNLDGRDGLKNLCWTSPRIPLFESCLYESGKPQLKEYNPQVFKALMAFYTNGLEM